MERPFPHCLFPPWPIPFSPTRIPNANLTQRVASLIDDTRSLTPLVHQITNAVAMTQSANVTLALGASPIMATARAEMEDLSKAASALLVNFGTIGDLEGMLLGGEAPLVSVPTIVC
jgi:thiamine-phosphate diphosphorylase / hydroxyethylthiazole kinase